MFLLLYHKHHFEKIALVINSMGSTALKCHDIVYCLHDASAQNQPATDVSSENTNENRHEYNRCRALSCIWLIILC